jgi:hypothetical protein
VRAVTPGSWDRGSGGEDITFLRLILFGVRWVLFVFLIFKLEYSLLFL